MNETFDIHRIDREHLEGDAYEDWWEQLFELYEVSPECDALNEDDALDVGLISTVLEGAWEREAVGPALLTPEIQEQVLRQRTSSGNIVEPWIVGELFKALRAFWSFAERSWGLENAAVCRSALTPELESELEELVDRRYAGDRVIDGDEIEVSQGDLDSMMLPELQGVLTPLQQELLAQGQMATLLETLSPDQNELIMGRLGRLAQGRGIEPDRSNRKIHQVRQRQKNRKKEKAARKARKKNRR